MLVPTPPAASSGLLQTASRRTGVLTFHRCINYGSYWQARCLVEGLQKMGRDTVLLDHHSSRVDRAEWRCALRPVLPTPAPAADRRLYARKVRYFFEALDGLPRSRMFSLDDPREMEDVDTVVVGSDEVWNLAHPWYGHKPIFFGEGLRADRLVAYAASFGNHPAELGLPAPWARRLRNFESLAVRDDNAATLVALTLGQTPTRVLDPCLLFAAATQTTQCIPRSRCLVVYGHNFSRGFSERVRAQAQRHGLATLSIGYRNDWADAQWITAGPEDFARAMAAADVIATNFFHGCVFALRSARPLLCERSPYRAIKIENLLTTLDAQRHLLDSTATRADFDACMTWPLAPSIGQRIAVERTASQAWLSKALEPRRGAYGRNDTPRQALQGDG